MAARRIIPTLLVRGRTLVKGERFDSWRSIGHALQAARVHARRQVDELLILDIAATAEGRGPNLQMVSELADGCFIPITVGGGVRSLHHIDALLRAGADKVAICTHATETFLRSASDRFGRQAIVVVIEHDDPRFDIAAAVQNACAYGAGEVVLQSVQRDGTMEGYDLQAIRKAAEF
jgi:cyclase